MGKRADIVSKKYVLRDLVLKQGGAMGISQLLDRVEFRHGWDAADLRRLAFQLRREFKATEGIYGVEAWEILDSVIIGLEKHLTDLMRRRINRRRQAKIVGVAEQNRIDNIVFGKRVTRKEIKRKLRASSEDLVKTQESSQSVKQTLDIYARDFADSKGKRDGET